VPPGGEHKITKAWLHAGCNVNITTFQIKAKLFRDGLPMMQEMQARILTYELAPSVSLRLAANSLLPSVS